MTSDAGAAAGAERAVAQRLRRRNRRAGRGRARRRFAETRAHMMHVREAYNPADFEPEPAMLKPWTDPRCRTPSRFLRPATGSLYGSAKRVREQVAELRDVGVSICFAGPASAP